MENWNTLIHNGPLFPPEYVYRQIKVSVLGKIHVFSAEVEELLTLWAQRINTECVLDKTFKKNYWNDLKPYLPKDLQKTQFPNDWDFTEMVQMLNQIKIDKKSIAKDQRLMNESNALKLKEKHGYAILNGERMALNSYIVEPPGIFMTRGKHPKYGCIKPRLKQSDITINASEPLEGDWKAQICNKEGFYIASWKQQVTGDTKYILFGSNSPVRQENDMIKFDKVHNLVKNLPNILSHIEKDLENNVGYQRKLATCCMLIASLAIRVGDEKGEDEADTRGATTLQAKHFTISNDQVTLDFLGKDSIRYHRAITMSPAMCANLSQLLSNKEPDELMFNGISSKEVNEYFSSILAGTTAKQFRTAYGSKLLADNLQGIKQELTEREKLKAFNDANLVVAEKLNHHKAPPKNAKEQIGSKKDSLKNLKEEYKKIQKSVKSAKSDKEKLLAKQTACANKIQNMEDKIELQQKMLTVSMGTSKTNYSDPRITYSFCKKHGVNINTIYTATLQDKFSWAQNIDDSFFQNYGKII